MIMYEYSVGTCRACNTIVLEDESYYKLGKTPLEGVLCEGCNEKVNSLNKIDFGQKLTFK